MAGDYYQYRVEVTRQRITGRLTTPEGEQIFEMELIADNDEQRLRRATIDVLRSWLNRWTALTRMSEKAEYAQLTVRNTFTVLGEHLYATIFSGEVERGLQEARRAARSGASVLRVLLGFQSVTDELAQLPWELLYHNGEFLANEHRLVLARNLSQHPKQVQTIPTPPLVVAFLVTVPDTKAYHDQREQLLQALPEPSEYSASISSMVLDHWDEDEAAKLLSTPPYPQVVHVIGVCRQIRDQDEDVLQIYLDDGETVDWRSPRMLVNLFSLNEELPPSDQVRLVVLHLCEPSPLDFRVTFERLAPELVRKGIPAVLAMQYPLSGRAAGRFVKKLYEALGEGRTIEQAVQRARSDLYVKFEQDRLFGSPVLYMQSVESRLLPLSSGSPAGADAGPSSVSATQAPPRSSLEFLLQQLDGIQAPPDLRGEAEKILREIGDWPPQLTEVERLVARQARDYAYRRDLAQVFIGLGKAIQQMSRRDD
jgi:CHAT domain